MNKQKLGKSFIHSVIDKILLGRTRGLKAWEVNNHIERLTGRKYSDSSTTARMREMNHIKCNLSDNTYKSTKTRKARVI